ncbi:MAG: AAA family ATPase [Verrucomicrobiales bacterium]
MPQLIFLEGPWKGNTFEFPAGGVTLGGAEENDLVLAGDDMVAAQHARLKQVGKGWQLTGLAETFLNDHLVSGGSVNDGDNIRVGRSLLRFSVAGGVAGLGEGDLAKVAELHAAYSLMREQLGKVIIGQAVVIEELLIAIFCRGHALLVGVPGLAKTLLVSSLSEALELKFRRVQFTPDLMPSDITGTDVLEEDSSTGKRVFRFVRGPIFANMVLADEINRTPPKTQAALLEAMQERHVTVGEQTLALPDPFFVLATQNPIEQEGTFPLPEAQLDRFMMSIHVDYPTAEEEDAIMMQESGATRGELEKVLDAQRVIDFQQLVKRVPVAEFVVQYARKIVRSTRPKTDEAPPFVKDMVMWGAGPRAGISLLTAAKAHALLSGRGHVTTGDIDRMAFPVLRHRVMTSFNAEASGVTSDELIRMLLQHHAQPGELRAVSGC